MDQFATEEDFLNNKKFCLFYVSINKKEFQIVEIGNNDNQITKCQRNGQLRLSSLGSITYRPLAKLHLNSASDFSYTGVYANYAETYKESLKDVIQQALEEYNRMVADLEKRLSELTSNTPIVVKNCHCK